MMSRLDTLEVPMIRPRALCLAALAFLIVVPLSACAPAPNASGLHMMPMDELPAEVQSAPASVRTAYQFAAANPDVMEDLPCYCGCGGISQS